MDKTETLNRLRLAAGAAGAYMGAFVGGWDGLMVALVSFMALDYITGVLCAISERKLSSAIGFRGICRKALALLLCGAAHLLDEYVTGDGSVLRTAVVCFYLSNEGLSLLENVTKLGLPVPEKLKNVLSQTGKEEEICK